MPIDRPIWLRAALTPPELQALAAIGATPATPGARLELTDQLQQSLAPVTERIGALAPGMFPVRAVAFDKTAQSNWTLPWHQDRIIAVAARHPVPGYGNWSEKHGVWHGEPPTEVLAQMLFVRVHLDACDADTGAMEIAEGSHAAGVVSVQQAMGVAQDYPRALCTAHPGDILILPMLTLHRSRAAAAPATRRVLRLDYAASPLPAPLAWAH